MGNKVKLLTLGCKVNQYESEAMGKLFEDQGYELVDDGKADIYIINTCTVTNLSARKSRQFLSRARKENPDGIIALTGCYPQVSTEEVEELKGVDIILGTRDRDQIVDLCQRALAGEKNLNLVTDLREGVNFEDFTIDYREDKTRGYVKVQEGCDRYCSYCIIPYARGPVTSRDLEDSVKEVERLVVNGFKEVVLTGIHVASYGLDLGQIGLIDLIEAVAQVPGLERLRLSSLEPKIIDKDFMERVYKIPEFCPHFHLSLQAGSDEILKAMNRRYTREEYRDTVELIRSYYPLAGITTDIIVGFPGETEENFNETLDLVEETGFSRIHVFRYSIRKGTKAATMKNQIPGDVKRDRSDRLIELGERLKRDFEEKLLGQTLQVLFEEGEDGIYSGYSENYSRVEVASPTNLEGEIKSVIIEAIDDKALQGKLAG